MSIHRFDAVQIVPISRDEAWAFFSDPRNLARITPPDMRFQIVDEPPARVYPGLIVRYRVRPLFGVPLTWLTEITHVREGEYFVDEQRAGPYRLWHHQHHLADAPGGTEVRDVVHYVLPLGPLGAVLNRFVIGPRVRHIFEHRRRVLARLFRARDAAIDEPGTSMPAGSQPSGA